MDMQRIHIAACDPDGYFLDKQGARTDAFSFRRSPDMSPDRAALFSLLQFGAVIPPLSPWEGISRLLPGYVYGGEGVERPLPFPASASGATGALTAFADIFDATLLRLIGDAAVPVVLFSGGVDSGLIAARLARLGYRDTLLLNFSFGPDDRESALAEDMARELGLKFERVTCEKLGCGCLDNPGKIWPLPFGDASVVPTFALANAAVERLRGMPCVVFDGTGADGGFGMARKISQWSQLAKLPKCVLRLASVAYKRGGQWHRTGAVEYRLRLLSRLNDMPLLSAILAQNPLAGVVYAGDGRKRVDDWLDEWVSGWAGDSVLRKVIAADLAMTCANTFAQKAYPIFKKANRRVVYPFMEPEMVGFALSIAPSAQSSEKKAILKTLLSQQVPHEMVYRPKSGFVDPSGQVFYDPRYIELLWAATEEESALSGMLFKMPVRKVCDLLYRKRSLPVQMLNCIWTIAFVDRWYRTA
jgi:asparagine synthetase B (glutamine-hydrolysing)